MPDGYCLERINKEEPCHFKWKTPKRVQAGFSVNANLVFILNLSGTGGTLDWAIARF